MQIVTREKSNAAALVSVDSFCERMIDERAELAGVEPVTGHSVSVRRFEFDSCPVYPSGMIDLFCREAIRSG
jgi:hypothetical protein